MCIIVAKEKGVRMPSTETLKHCFTNNPDGAGIMLASKGRVFGFKGLMTFDAFEAKLKQLSKRFGSLDKLPIVMHFRIMTHGKVVAGNTHPFPVSSSYKSLRKLEWVSDLGMAHNGIISCTSSHPDVKAEGVSDTMVFIKRIVAPVAGSLGKMPLMSNSAVLDALQIASGSKLAFLSGNGEIKVLGSFIRESGVYYSNDTYVKPRLMKMPEPYHSYWWDWEDYDYKPSRLPSNPVVEDSIRLNDKDIEQLMWDTAEELGIEIIPDWYDLVVDYLPVGKSGVTYGIGDGILLYWDKEELYWVVSTFADSNYVFVGGEEDD